MKIWHLNNIYNISPDQLKKTIFQNTNVGLMKSMCNTDD